MGFPLTKVFEVVEYDTMNSHMVSSGYVGGLMQFKLAKGTACPLCRKGDGHTNAYWLGKKADGSRRVKSMSDGCFPGYVSNAGRWVAGTMRSVEVPWTSAGLAGWLADMRRRGTPASEAAVAELARAYPYFPNPCDVFFYEQRRLVLRCDKGLAVVLYGPRETGTNGCAVASLTDAPWAETVRPSWPVPLPASFFEKLQSV
jgi:hypothetical protein